MTRKFHHLIVIVLLSIFNTGCSKTKKVEKEVLEASKQWIYNFNKGNAAEITNAYTEDAIMEAKPFGTFEGRKAIGDFWTPFIESGATDLKYSNTEVKVINEEKVMISSGWSMNVGKGIITNETWVKIDGQWKLQEDHFEVKEQFSNNKNSDAMNKKETYVLVHSAWLGGWQWENVAKTLKEKGHTVLTPDLPGHGNDKTAPANITMESYVQTLTNILDQQDNAVILVGHSFNGITVSRVAELRPKKVKSLVYLTAFLLPNGGSFFGAVQGVEGSTAVDNFYLSEDKTYAMVKQEEIQNAFAQDISKEAFEGAKPYIVPEPAAPLMYELQITDDNFGNIPKYYIECTNDNAIPIAVQRAMYTGNVLKVYSINSGHTPNFSNPNKVAEALLDVVKEGKKINEIHKSLESQTVGVKKIHRLFSNESHVLAHVETYSAKKDQTYANMVLLDKKEGGIHYTIKQKVPENQVGNNTMFNGVTNGKKGNTKENKAIIQRFLNDVWIKGNIDIINEFFHNGKVIQHNPMVENNIDGLFNFMINLQEQGITLQYQEVIATFASGNIVMTYSKGMLGGEPLLFADLFRMEGGKIVEHWDVIQKE